MKVQGKSLCLSLWLTWGVALGVGISPLAAAESLDKELLKQAPEIIKQLKARGYKNVGVLKFRARKGKEPASDNIGPLNLTMANRLEIALVLADDNEENQQIGIIRNASAVAARLPAANHLTGAGRQALLQGTYPLAWGNQKVKADAFITGIIQINPDLEEMTVKLLVFDKDDDKLFQLIPPFQVATESSDLVEAGESFILRSVFGRKATKATPAADKEVAHEAAKAKANDEAYPLNASVAPVSLEVQYDNHPVKFGLKNGKALIPEPGEGQKVVFVIKRKDPGPETYGVVLLVNGENVLFKQKVPPVRARKFVLGPNDAPVVVRGYRVSKTEVREFRVLSAYESTANAVNYGADVGTVTLVVFRGKKQNSDVPLPGDDAEDLAAIRGGIFPTTKPENLGALKAQLRSDPVRGLIGDGKSLAVSSNEVSFKPDPTPVMTATLTYFKPSGK